MNTAGGLEFSPYISPDGLYFFFMSRRVKTETGNLTLDRLRDWHGQPQNGNPDIYWMEASFIGTLKPE